MIVVHAEPKRHEWGRCANLSVSLCGPRKLARNQASARTVSRVRPMDGLKRAPSCWGGSALHPKRRRIHPRRRRGGLRPPDWLERASLSSPHIKAALLSREGHSGVGEDEEDPGRQELKQRQEEEREKHFLLLLQALAAAEFVCSLLLPHPHRGRGQAQVSPLSSPLLQGTTTEG